MGEYAAIEKEAKLFTELCVHNDAIDPNLFDEFGVKRGLRDKDGNGVLAGITNISRIDAFEMRDGVKTPCDGKLWYRGYNVYDLIRGLRGNGYLKGAVPSTRGPGWTNLWCTSCHASGTAGQLCCPAQQLCAGRYHESPQQGSDEQPDPQRADPGFL